jgi:predicted DNA-binding transcriptional regulator YafY
MNKTDRLLAIILELQRKGLMRAEDLAASLEISTRTIYRDIQALCEAGVPVVGAPGMGYSLMEGYFLPPVSFTPEEAVALLLGTDFIEMRFDSDWGSKASSARGKIEATLPEGIRAEASRARKTTRLLNSGEARVTGHEKRHLEVLRRAILEKRKVRLDYSKGVPGADRERNSVRDVAPYGLALVQHAWMLVAHCDLRQELRHFRLSRIQNLTLLDTSFELPADFRLEEYKPRDDRHTTVRILADPDIAERIRESGYFFIEGLTDREDGLEVTLRVRELGDVLQWMLGWGAKAVVLEPEELRSRIREEAQNMWKRY